MSAEKTFTKDTTECPLIAHPVAFKELRQPSRLHTRSISGLQVGGRRRRGGTNLVYLHERKGEETSKWSKVRKHVSCNLIKLPMTCPELFLKTFPFDQWRDIWHSNIDKRSLPLPSQRSLILSSHWIQAPLIVSNTESIIQTWPLSARTGGHSCNRLMVHMASGASERNTLSSCGTNRETLMPRCHCQYIQTMMMFPHKYLAASKTHSVWMEEETCVVSLLKGSRLKVNEEKSLDAPDQEGQRS